MKKFKLMLQMFNDEATPETQPVVEQTQEVSYTSEGVMKWLESTDEGKKILQPIRDKAVTQGLQTWQEKNVDKIKETEREAVTSEMQKQIDELNNSLVSNRVNSELKLKLLSEGAEKEDIDLLMTAIDVSKITVDGEKIIGLNDVVNNFKESRPKWFGKPPVNAAGRDTIAEGGESPAAGSGKLTREQVNKLSSNERIVYKMKNPDWAK